MIYESERPIAFIVGLDSMQGLQTARTMRNKKVPVVGIAKDKKYHSCRTNACDLKLYVDTESEELIKLLEKIGPQLKKKAVIIPCQDLNVQVISLYRERLLKWFHIMLPEHEIIEKLLNKADFYDHVLKEKLPLSPTYILKNYSDLERIKNEIIYPCVLKPSVRTTEWLEETSLKAFKVFTEDDLIDLYKKYSSFTDRMIIQQWVDGTDMNLFTCFCYYDNRSKPVITFTSKKIRQWPPLTGQRTLGVEARNEFVEKTTLDLYNSVPFKGLGYLELKKDETTGNYYIIEANVGRPVGPSSLAERAGVEILYTFYCDCVGLERPGNLKQQYKETKWVHLVRDLQSFLYLRKRRQLTFIGWLKSLKGKRAYAIFSWKDPLPFLFLLMKIIRLILFSSEKEKKTLSQSPVQND